MALTVPSSESLTAFMGLEELDEDQEEYATLALQMAADLFWLATGLTTDPSDEQELRIVGYAIMSMAEYFLAVKPVQGSMYRPLSSERIGSYSYSKASQVTSGISTDVMWFDQAVEYFNGLEDGEAFALSSATKVFDYDGSMKYTDIEGNQYIFGPAIFTDPNVMEKVRPFG